MENSVFDISELFRNVVEVHDTPMDYVKMLVYANNTTSIIVLNKSGQLNYFSPISNTILPTLTDPILLSASGECPGGSASITNNYTTFIESWSNNNQKFNDIIMS